jgi:hypothetical protein
MNRRFENDRRFFRKPVKLTPYAKGKTYLGPRAAVHRLFKPQHEVGELLLPFLGFRGFPLLEQP